MSTTPIEIKKKVLSENDRLANELRSLFHDRKVLVLNLVSSPGSGKTSLLEKTLQRLKDEMRIGLIAGDVQTENDANRLKRAGGEAVQALMTGGSCHLDAAMISKTIKSMNLDELDLLVIENVGNLVCPASFDLGEDMKVVLISTTEGDDKPLKYPVMFRRSSIMVINKIDLLKYTDFEMESVKANALSINGQLRIFELSCRTEEGFENWFAWLKRTVETKKTAN